MQQFLVKNKIPATPNHHILQLSVRVKSGSSKGSGLGIHKIIKQTKTASLTASNIKRGLQTCFQQWLDHWTKYVRAEGHNFQGDYVPFYTYPIYNKLQPSSRNFPIIPHKYSTSFQFSLQLLVSWWSGSPSHYSEWLHIHQLSQIIDTFLSSQPLHHPHEPALVTQHSSTTWCRNLWVSAPCSRPSTYPRSFLHIATYLFIPLLMEISEENIGLLCHYDWKKETHVYTLKVLSNSDYNTLITTNKNNYYIENVLT